jgi:hypothetical protein
MRRREFIGACWRCVLVHLGQQLDAVAAFFSDAQLTNLDPHRYEPNSD